MSGKTGRDALPRLGRGLAALLGEMPAGTARAAATVLPVEALEPSPFQPRVNMDPDSLADLVQSIRSQGVLQPILVRPHPSVAPGGEARYQIIAGERRWRAAQGAGLHDVPVLVRALSDSDAMAAALVENLQRQDLDAIEEAEGYKRLVQEFGLTQDQLGSAVGKSRSHVANTLRLLNLPGAVRTEVQSGKLSAGHARALLSHPDPAKAAAAVIARGLNVRQTEALAARPGKEPGQARRPDPETAALERELSDRLGLRVQVTHERQGGSVRIHYRTLDQLDGLLAVLNRG